MAKSSTTSKRTAGPASRVLSEPKGSGSAVKTVAASALTQISTRASPGSEQVIKEISHEYRDALKRLADR